MGDSGLSLGDMLTIKMSYDGERQKILAQNISSMDTPGYKAQDFKALDFRNVLASQTQQVPLAVTSSGHMNGQHAYTPRFVSLPQRDTYERTPVGSTVVVEEQMTKVAQNATDYTMTTNLYHKIGNLFREAIGLQASS